MDSRFNGIVAPLENDPKRSEGFIPILYEPDSHASNLLQLDNGDILCVWFNGSGEGNPDTNVVMSRLPAGSNQWTTPVELANHPELTEQNPVLFQDPDGKLWLFHTQGEPHDQKKAHVMFRTSEDRGYTWSEPKLLFEGPGIFLRHPVVVMKNGEWLLPCYYCKEGGHYSVVKISSDKGKTWTEYEVPNSIHRVQMSVVEFDDGTLFGLFRSRQAERIYVSISKDHGRTWTPPAKTNLPNNNSSFQLTKLPNGHLALIYNNVSIERDQFRWVESKGSFRRKTLRTPLTIAISEDNGKTWPYRKNIQTADLEYKDSLVGYSYPSIMGTKDGKIHISFSYLRKAIKYVVVDEEWVKENHIGPEHDLGVQFD